MSRLRGMTIWISVLAIATGCGTAAVDKAGGPTQPPAPLRLTAANVFDLDSVHQFIKELETGSNGGIKIDVESSFGVGTPDAEAGAIDQVRSGKADIGMVGSRAWPTVGVTTYDALLAPFLIDSYGLEQQVLESEVVDDMATGLEPLGLVGIGVLPGDLRVVLGRTRAFERPADFVGASVAFSKSAVAELTYRTLGASTTSIAGGDPIDRFDGAEVPVQAITGNNYDKFDRIVAGNVRISPRPIVIFMSKSSFEKLSADQRAALRSASRAAIPATLRDVELNEAESAATACRRGVDFQVASDDDLSALRAAVQPVYDRLEADPMTKRLIVAIANEKSKRGSNRAAITCDRASPAPVASDAPSPSQATATSPIDGVWETCPTAEDIIAVGGAPAEAGGNAGCTTLSFVGGAFRESGASAATTTPGGYVVAGDRITINRANGEVFTFGWSVFEDTLTLKASKVAGAISPAPWVAKPFLRTGG